MRLMQPNWPRFLPSTLVLGIATLGPLGRRLPAPGTWGSRAGLLYFMVFFVDRLSLLPAILLGALGLYVAVGFCGEAEFRMGRKDPGEVILDEFMAMPLCFIGWPALLDVAPRWAVFLAGFALFRLFDITKPWPANWLDVHWHTPFSVIADDLVAAFYAALVAPLPFILLH